MKLVVENISRFFSEIKDEGGRDCNQENYHVEAEKVHKNYGKEFFHGENPFKSVKVQLVAAWPPRKNVCASRKRRRRHGGEYSR
jgi:hypothetical protein